MIICTATVAVYIVTDVVIVVATVAAIAAESDWND